MRILETLELDVLNELMRKKIEIDLLKVKFYCLLGLKVAGKGREMRTDRVMLLISVKRDSVLRRKLEEKVLLLMKFSRGRMKRSSDCKESIRVNIEMKINP